VVYSLAMSYAGNNNVVGANDSVNGNNSYVYDDLNRLASASGTRGSFTWTYDRYGNRWQQNGVGPGANKSNNQLLGFNYDADGNQSSDAAHSYIYDAENRIIQVDGTPGNCSTATACYAYGADGTRVQKTASGVVTNYLYDLAGQRLAELGATGTWNRGEIYAGGMHLVTYANGTTYFDHGDWLGTERLRLSVSGGVADSCTSDPYGDGQSCTGAESDMHFTGKPRDTEDNLDYFGARYYGSSLGRFMTPDWAGKPTAVPYANYGDPQSLNLYAYVRNNPVSGIDPDGHLGPGNPENKGCGVNGDFCDDGESAAEQAAAEKAAQPPQQTQLAQNQSQGQTQQNQPQTPAPQPAPTDPQTGKPTPPPVPVPGCPTCGWVWSPDPQNTRGGRWVPDNYPSTPGGIPGASWDPGSRGGPGHWDVDDGKGNRTRHYPDGRTMPNDVAHPPGWRPPTVSPNTVRQVTFWGTVAAAGAALIQAIGEMAGAF
jgi:RHS repeat-associated protein